MARPGIVATGKPVLCQLGHAPGNLVPLGTPEYFRPLQPKPGLLQQRKVQREVVKVLARRHPGLGNVRLDGDLVHVVQKGGVLPQNVPGQGELAPLAIHLDDGHVLQPQPVPEFRHGRRPPLLRAALVGQPLLVGHQHGRTHVVKGHQRVQLGGVRDGRIARKAAAVPQIGQLDVEAGVVVDPEAEKGAAVGRFRPAQGVSRGKLHQLALAQLEFFPLSGVRADHLAVLGHVPRTDRFDRLVLLDGIHFFPEFPIGVQRNFGGFQREHVGFGWALWWWLYGRRRRRRRRRNGTDAGR
mmetsp:Transcript_25756/g.53772  ORF Transcript_25756/g.53772 Transcript_25756/m.53772 type:complete len:297 (+) Transcript_25756:353-1243(+)